LDGGGLIPPRLSVTETLGWFEQLKFFTFYSYDESLIFKTSSENYPD
jgi:hypothetical protein